MRFSPALLFLFFFVFPVAVQAELSADEHSVQQLPQMVVTATRVPSNTVLDPAAITVIDREEIERSGAPNVAELLRFVPGVDVRITGQTGGQTSVFMRGANSNHTLVLIDGVRANSTFSGTYDFAHLTVVNVERVEVLSGPQSLLYGSEALGGVINIVTRRGRDGAAGSLELAAGSHERAEGRGFLALGGNKVTGSLSGSWIQTDNGRENSAYRAGDMALSGDWRASEDLSLGFQASIFDSKTGIPNDRFTNDPNDEGRTLDKRAAVSLEGTPFSWWSLGLVASHARDRLEFEGTEPNPPYFSGDVMSTTEGKRSLVDLQNVLEAGRGHRVLLGATFEMTDADHSASSSYGETELNPDQESRSVFGAYDYRGGDRFEVNVGGRLDDYSTFGSHGTWRAGGRLALPSSLVARGNIGTGFRAPSLADLFYPGFSNPDLKPEESLGWDLGLEAGLAADRIKVRAAWFSNRFTNLIAYSTVAFRPENIAEARTEGLETSLDWEVGSRWNIRASYTWLPTAEDRTRNARLLRRAKHAGSLNLYGPIVAGLALDARVLAVGSSADSDFSAYPVAEVTNAGYLKMDMGAAVRLGTRATATLRVENLFGKSYEETFGYPALGRIFRVGMAVGF